VLPDNPTEIQTLATSQHQTGFELRQEQWTFEDGSTQVMYIAYTLKGDFIGSPHDAYALMGKHGIQPEKARPNDSICSIGFCKRQQRWYGWSHRAICGFGIGDKVFIERFGDDRTPPTQHGRTTITNMRQAKTAAKRYADSVS